MGDLLELIMEFQGNLGVECAFWGRAKERSQEDIDKDAKWNIAFVVVILVAVLVAGCCAVAIGIRGFFDKGEAGGLLTAAFGAATVVGLGWHGDRWASCTRRVTFLLGEVSG